MTKISRSTVVELVHVYMYVCIDPYLLPHASTTCTCIQCTLLKIGGLCQLQWKYSPVFFVYDFVKYAKVTCILMHTCVHVYILVRVNALHSGLGCRPPDSPLLPDSQLHGPTTAARPMLWLFLCRHGALYHHAEGSLVQVTDQEATGEAEHHQRTDGVQSEIWGATHAEEYSETAMPDHKVRFWLM